MISIIFPAFPSATIWGLMIAHVQLVNIAVVFSLVFSPKTKSHSRWAEPANQRKRESRKTPQTTTSLYLFTRITSVASISNSFFTVESSQTVGCLNSRNLIKVQSLCGWSAYLTVGGTDQCSPFLDSILRNKFHANNEITTHEVSELLIERFSLQSNIISIGTS
jgi:hypothetical protein